MIKSTRFQESPSIASSWTPFHGVHVLLSRLRFLFLGVFCLTGMVGCLLHAVVLGSKPFADVIAWIVFTGTMAVIYLVLAPRAPRWLLAGVLLHILGSMLVRHLLLRLNFDLSTPDVQSGVRFAAVTNMVLCFASCAFFLLFLYRNDAIRFACRLNSRSNDNVGSDLVDVVARDDGSLLGYVADISCHGLPAGILMGASRRQRGRALLNPGAFHRC
jgi:hypothetical protein